tara:strand:+ start:6643 stop:6930 length:288 start_codon:yes stop_codon:yes gene_type:complete
MDIFKFKETTTTEFEIVAVSPERAIQIMDEIWWNKQYGMKKYLDSKQAKCEKQNAWIEYDFHVCKYFIFGDDEDKAYCEECDQYYEKEDYYEKVR